MTHHGRRRLAVGVVLVAWLVLTSAAPASAHGVGGRADLPLPLWLFTYGAGGALVASFVALRVLWPTPRLRDAAPGRELSPALDRMRLPALLVGRALGIASLGLVLVAAWWGSDDPAANLAPVAVYVVFWVGFQLLAAVLGPVWQLVNPFDTIAAAIERVQRPHGGHGMSDRRIRPADPGHWSAAVLLFSFVWLELAYYDSASPTALALWLTAYLAAVVAGTFRWGRGWLGHGEGFTALFDLLAHLSPLHVEAGRLRLRPPFSGLSTYHTRQGTAALILVVLGSTSFDGLTRTELWADVVGDRTGWAQTTVSTVGLVLVISLMTAVYLAAMSMMARNVDRDRAELGATFLPSLIPIVLAYTLAHYFSLLIFEGQGAYALLSDPFGRGWDLFGTVDHSIDYLAVSVDTIAFVQAGAIVFGHIVGVVAAHDRAVELFPRRLAESSQYPLLGVMVLYTVGGLALLLGG